MPLEKFPLEPLRRASATGTALLLAARCLHILQDHSQVVYSVAFSPSEKILLACGSDDRSN